MGTYAIAKRLMMEECVCIVCGIDYGVPEQLLKEHRRVGGFHCCPNGHSQGWKQGTYHERTNALERELQAEQERKRAALERLNEAEQRAAKAEAEMRRHKRRTKNGVCPCCNRTFQQLARHMATKHPEFKP